MQSVLHLRVSPKLRNALLELSDEPKGSEFRDWADKPGLKVSDIMKLAEYLKSTQNTKYRLFELLEGAEPYCPPPEPKKRVRLLRHFLPTIYFLTSVPVI
jgi:hypothetical protein